MKKMLDKVEVFNEIKAMMDKVYDQGEYKCIPLYLNGERHVLQYTGCEEDDEYFSHTNEDRVVTKYPIPGRYPSALFGIANGIAVRLEGYIEYEVINQ